MSKQDKKDNEGEVIGSENQAQLQIDESKAIAYYASTARVWGSAEELIIDLAQRLTPTGENKSLMRIDARVIMSPWAAKRLAMALGQAVQRYEQSYGTLEVDPRKRLAGGIDANTELN